MALIQGVYDLKAFQEAYALVLDILPLTENMKDNDKFNSVASQMRRASTSVCANLAEGFGKNGSRIELRRFVRISLGSAHEMDFWLKLSGDMKYMNPEIAGSLRQRYKTVCKLLNGFEQSLVTKTQKHEASQNTENRTRNTVS